MEMVNNIKKRETSSIYEENGRKFKLNAYDPIEGNYILVQLFTFVLPFGIGDAVKDMIGSESSESSEALRVPQGNKMMSKVDFINLEKDILRTIEEVYENGNTSPVLRSNGTYGVADVSMSLVVKLLIASLAFNFKDFFEDVPLLDSFMNR